MSINGRDLRLEAGVNAYLGWTKCKLVEQARRTMLGIAWIVAPDIYLVSIR